MAKGYLHEFAVREVEAGQRRMFWKRSHCHSVTALLVPLVIMHPLEILVACSQLTMPAHVRLVLFPDQAVIIEGDSARDHDPPKPLDTGLVAVEHYVGRLDLVRLDRNVGINDTRHLSRRRRPMDASVMPTMSAISSPKNLGGQFLM